jgi:hypothetical protein
MQTTTTTEIWKPVVGMEEYYQVSNHGRIMRCEGSRGTFDGRLLNPSTQKNGYRVVTLHGGGKVVGRAVARLVAEAFIPRPEGAHRVYHKGDIGNDHAANLGWIVREERSKRRGAPPAPCQEEKEKEPTPVPTVKSALETELDTKVEDIMELARMMRREAVELRERYHYYQVSEAAQKRLLQLDKVAAVLYQVHHI